MAEHKITRWLYVGCGELGMYFACPRCGCKIVLNEFLGTWTPQKCPNCKLDMIVN